MPSEHMSRISMMEVMMFVTHVIAKRSTCSRAQVGVVIADRRLRQILSFGYNGNWAGGPNECDSSQPGMCGCIHAEENALIKLTSPENGLRLFTTTSPCAQCAKRIINQGGITHVFFAQQYRDPAGLELLNRAGIFTEQLAGASRS